MSFDITLTANSDLDGVDLEAIYKYDQPVLNSDFGFGWAKLDKMNGDSQNFLDSVYGEFAESLQSLDLKRSPPLKRIDLTQSEGLSFDSIRVGSRQRANSEEVSR